MQENSMKEEAQRILSEAHMNEHRENMDINKKLYNGALAFLVFILILFFGPHFWQLCFAPLFQISIQIKIPFRK